MGKANFTDDFKRGAVLQIIKRGDLPLICHPAAVRA